MLRGEQDHARTHPRLAANGTALAIREFQAIKPQGLGLGLPALGQLKLLGFRKGGEGGGQHQLKRAPLRISSDGPDPVARIDLGHGSLEGIGPWAFRSRAFLWQALQGGGLSSRNRQGCGLQGLGVQGCALKRCAFKGCRAHLGSWSNAIRCTNTSRCTHTSRTWGDQLCPPDHQKDE